MSYKNELEGNNADLRAILDTVNALPDAGGGGGGGGIIPAGTKNITENGVYDVTEYAQVDVDVPTSGGATGGITGVTKTSSSFTLIKLVAAEAAVTLPKRVVTKTSAEGELNG